MLVLIANPGSSSRKYALYQDKKLLCSLHFEYERTHIGKKVICTLATSDGQKKTTTQPFADLGATVAHLTEILKGAGVFEEKLDGILVRVTCSGTYFTRDHIVDEEYLQELEAAKHRSPLHVPVVAAEVEHFVENFRGIPIVSISDSAFHNERPELSKRYAIGQKLAAEADVFRFGYHGLSVGSVVHYLRQENLLTERMVVCHLGSGSSVTAVLKGKSHDTTMGYTPLEGLVMATRCGNLDISAALRLKHHFEIEDETLEKYLNKECGLLGLSGKTDDMREIIRLRDEGDKDAAFAFDLFVYRLRGLIGQMVASMGGLDALVFTATIGERSAPVRAATVEGLGYLGLKLDKKKNETGLIGRHVDIAAEDSKPVLVVQTDETAEMLRRAQDILQR